MGSMEPLFLRAAFENIMCKCSIYTTLTLELCTSASTVAITHVSQLLHQEFDVHKGLRAHKYYQKHVETIETMSETSE